MTEIRIVDASEQHTAVVRQRVPITTLAEFFSRAFEATLQAVREQRVVPVGPPFGKYLGPSGENIDVEAGLPVAIPIDDDGGVLASTLPGGRVVEAVHVGPYDTMVQTYAEIEAWMAEQGLRPGPVMWENYLTDPGNEPDPSTWRTLVMWPTA